jgi:hypothetical protein
MKNSRQKAWTFISIVIWFLPASALVLAGAPPLKTALSPTGANQASVAKTVAPSTAAPGTPAPEASKIDERASLSAAAKSALKAYVDGYKAMGRPKTLSGDPDDPQGQYRKLAALEAAWYAAAKACHDYNRKAAAHNADPDNNGKRKMKHLDMLQFNTVRIWKAATALRIYREEHRIPNPPAPAP